MSGPAIGANAPTRQIERSTAAILDGFLAVVLLSLGTDQLLHMANVYPPWGQAMHDPALNFLALSYRLVYTVAGNYLTARLAPHSPLRHVWILGWIGLFFGTMGVIAALKMDLGPIWDPIALAGAALPRPLLGGAPFRPRPAPIWKAA